MKNLKRRDFLKISAAGGAACAVPGGLVTAGRAAGSELPVSASTLAPGLVSPGCRRSKVRVAKLYLGLPNPHWPKPSLDLKQEVKSYEVRFEGMKDEFADVDFVTSALVGAPEEVQKLADKLKDVDGILVIHLTIWVGPVLDAVLELKKPTVIFAAPYSGHEWVTYGGLLKQEKGRLADCLLTSDYRELARAVRPFRAIHHLREARVLNLTTSPFEEYAARAKDAFGTDIKRVTLERIQKLYAAVSEADARRETELWFNGAEKVVEPSRADVYASARLALAFERLLDEEEATVLTVDCYGSMWDGTIKLPAFPCLGFSRLNNRGFGGICESDLRSAMTHIIMQGLSGRPGFISDPTVDEGTNSIILAHCMGTVNMDGPGKTGHPYKLRTVMEREQGVVPQVQMRLGQKVTQAILVGMDMMPYFTGEIVAAPVRLEDDRGCRTKIAVRVDGDLGRLWRNWDHGLHRVTCYGDLRPELRMFAKFKGIELRDEAA